MAYAYDLTYLIDTIANFLAGYNEDDCSIPYISGKPYYAYIINSSMTDIDLAFISSDVSKVLEFSEFGPESTEVAMFTAWDENITDDEREEYAEQLHQDGIDIICSEDGELEYLGDVLLLNKPLSGIIKDIDLVADLGLDPNIIADANTWGLAKILEDYILDQFSDNIYKDLYFNSSDDCPIFVVKKDYWRF